jgi:tRNA G10  N-methylase Trm11
MNTLFDLPEANPQHPAKYTDALLSAFVRMLNGCNRILDPFGGTGKVFLLNVWYPDMDIQAVEIEPEWARINPRTTLGNALALPWRDNYFDAICTSPTYGNRMADRLIDLSNCARDYNYITYSQKLNRNLHQDNSGAMQWGEAYREFHVKAWTEATRVLAPCGTFVLNIKNHIRAGKEQLVTEWHIETLLSLGYQLIEHEKINTPSMRYGQNSEKRIEYESVIKFTKSA